MIITISNFWKSSSLLGLLIDRNVLGYNWDYLKSGLRLSVNLKIKNSDTTYGMMFDTMSVSNQTKKTNKKWATFLSTFFDYNKDNQNIMLSAAKNNLNQKVNSFLFFKYHFQSPGWKKVSCITTGESEIANEQQCSPTRAIEIPAGFEGKG